MTGFVPLIPSCGHASAVEVRGLAKTTIGKKIRRTDGKVVFVPQWTKALICVADTVDDADRRFRRPVIAIPDMRKDGTRVR